MRDEMYQMMQGGASNDEIVGALVDRFGEFVQYKPPVDKRTIFLWAFPAIAVIGGLLIVAGVVMRSRKTGQQGTGLKPRGKAKGRKMPGGKGPPSRRRIPVPHPKCQQSLQD